MSKAVTASYSISSISPSTRCPTPIILNKCTLALLSVLLLFVMPLRASGELPIAEKPRIFIDTTYRHPSGATRFVGSGDDLQATLKAAEPGDTIVLDAGATYSGSFTLPAKNNPSQKWIYIVSSALSKLPAPGTRVSPANAVNMPKIVTPNGSGAFTVAGGGGYVRFVGIEMYSTSTYGANPTHTPWPINGFAYYLLGFPGASHVTVDRCYVHGSDTEDVNHAIEAWSGASYIAIVDSYISDIHGWTNDSQAFAAFSSPGPFKLVNNYLSASTEDVMFGGSGGYKNPYVASDIEIRNNHLFKDPAWLPKTQGGTAQWTVKNNLECKGCLRLVVTGNMLENAWKSADQYGENILLTPRPNQSGYNSVDNDITIQNNILKNANWGFSIIGYDNNCRPPNCTIEGETKRVVIQNNLILLRNSSDLAAFRPLGFSMGHRMDGMLIQHNTVIGINGSQPWASFYFNNSVSPDHPTNVWILDNVLGRQPTGDAGHQGQNALDTYMPLPAPAAARFLGNVMLVPDGDQSQAFPKGNVSISKAVVYKNGTEENIELSSNKQPRTSDGAPAGANIAQIKAAMVPPVVSPAAVRPEVVTLRATQTAEFHTATGSSAWRISPKLGSITPNGLYAAPARIKEPSGITVCAGDPEAGDACASIVLLPSS